jgi:xylose dehydrogenase (NAD/NADP)
VSVHGNNSQPLLEMIPDPNQWRLDPDLSGYGTSVMDLGIYSINTARYLLDRDPVAVQSQMSSHHEAFADVPDERSAAILVLEDDVKMVTTDSQHAQEETELKITGTEGQIEFQPAFHGEVTLRLSRGEVTVTVDHDTFDAEREMTEEFDYFADCVLTDTPVHADGRHGLTDMRVIEAIHRSAESGDVIEL